MALSRRHAALLAATTIALIILLLSLGLLGWTVDWIDDTYAARIQAIASAMQAAFTITLIWITLSTLKQTSSIAQETRDMARATEHLAVTAQAQRAQSLLPIISFRPNDKTPPLSSASGKTTATILAVNAGPSPAIDLVVRWDANSRHCQMEEVHQPLSLPSGEHLELAFRIHDIRRYIDDVFAGESEDRGASPLGIIHANYRDVFGHDVESTVAMSVASSDKERAVLSLGGTIVSLPTSNAHDRH